MPEKTVDSHKLLSQNAIDGKPVHVNIRGIHHKKVWYKKDDLVVIRGMEIWGKVSESDYSRVKRSFELLEGKGDASNIEFGDEGDDHDESDGDGEDDDVAVTKPTLKVVKKLPEVKANNAQLFGVTKNADESDSDSEINIDAI